MDEAATVMVRSSRKSRLEYAGSAGNVLVILIALFLFIYLLYPCVRVCRAHVEKKRTVAVLKKEASETKAESRASASSASPGFWPFGRSVMPSASRNPAHPS